MATQIRTNNPITVTTPLGPDVLLLTAFTGHEAISQLFSFEIDMIAERKTEVPFDRLLGQKVTVTLTLPDERKRHFNGICKRMSQGGRDETFDFYRAEIVPQFWLLTKSAQSRIFQHLTVPDILKQVLAGLDVVFEIQGTFHARDFCVQYRETDFNFAGRLMEEEGIYYFFKHSSNGHQMVVANTPQSHPPMPLQSKFIYEEVAEGLRDESRIWTFVKNQELRSGKYTLWDHCFELPHKHLEATQPITDSVQVGQVNHKMKVGNNDKLELYDFPGEYAQRFDGIDKGGGEKPADLQKIFVDNKRTVGIRMAQETVPGVFIEGTSNCRNFVSGHRLDLERHFNADGPYVLTRVEHDAHLQGNYRSGETTAFYYQNRFTCIPAALPFRPIRVTPKPTVTGTQTAVVVGPPGEEIFTDKYGRVKVQFHWDRQGKNDVDSSCWVRVTQAWAGKRWGAFFWPRIGQEVVVDFLEGDPDQPIIVGSVYNADQMPPYLGQGPDSKHPNDNKVSGIKTNTTKGGQGFNELRFDDTKGKEQVFIHAERNMDQRIKNDSFERVVNDRHLIVGAEKDSKKAGDQFERVFRDKHLHVHRHQIEHIGGNMELLIGGGDGDGTADISIRAKKTETIGADNDFHVKKDRKEKIDGSTSLTVGMNQDEKVGMNHALEAGMSIHIKAGMTLVIEAGLQLTLKVGGNFIDINPVGVFIQGTLVMINSGGGPGSGAGAKPASPTDAKEAKPTDPTAADDAKTGQKSAP
jgi:type VI secretion system secreted protein VgrG